MNRLIRTERLQERATSAGVTSNNQEKGDRKLRKCGARRGDEPGRARAGKRPVYILP